MKHVFLFFLFICSILSFGQANVSYATVDTKIAAIPPNETISTDAIANYIKANFKTENDKIRAVFYWTVTNISYELTNTLPDNLAESSQEKIEKTLKNRKGTSENYAEIFNDIANKIGVKSFVIEGLAKQKGLTDYVVHNWCGAKVDNKWYVFDPTWGSGFINKGRFFKKINNYYFKTEPNEIITSHIPYDYLWQFSNYPVSNQEVYEGKTQLDKTKKYFDFEAEISKYEKLSEIDRLITSAERVETNAAKSTTPDKVSNKKLEVENAKIDEAINLYNQGMVELNEFISFRNKQFTPDVSDEELSRMVYNSKPKLLKSQALLNNLGQVDKSNLPKVNAIKKDLPKSIKQADEQERFVVRYLSKSKTVRETMLVVPK